jgi:tetratricopeptide (TPR) repeat protein/transcriptional regulator with XRE-family HTH domain
MSTRDPSEPKKGAKSAPSLLKRERERRAWTQSDIAERIGTTQINVSRWENGATIPSPHFRQKLAELFGKSIEELDLLLKNVETKNSEEHAEETTTTLDTSDAHSISPAAPLWNVPYRRNPFFTGREEALAHLYNTLKDTKRRALPLAISGLGGIGKTQIAIEYAYRYSQDYSYIFWINATTHDTLNADFVTLATLLDLPEQNEQDQGTVIRAVKRWQANHTNWLLILDNVDNLAMIVSVLPTHGTGEVLLTTRLQALGTVAQCIEIENMSLDEGVKFLLCRIKAMIPGTSLDPILEESRLLAEKIVSTLDGLPLALDQAGAYIEETHCGLAQYLNLYATYRKELLLQRGRFPIDHPDSVAATWSISFQQVEQASPPAADLLRVLAFLDPEAIPEEIIIQGAEELSSTLAEMAKNPLQTNTTIGLLLRYSVIRRTSATKFLSIHRLVQAVLRDGMERETQYIWAERTIRAVIRVFPYVDPQTWQLQTWQTQTLEKYQRYLPHVQTCALFSQEYALAFPEVACLFHEAASYLTAHARYEEAEFLLLRTLEIRQESLKVSHPDITRTLNDLGELYLNWGKYEQSKHYLQEALEMHQQELGKEHPDIAQIYYNLASLHRSQGAYDTAEPFYLQALRLRKEKLGTDHPLVAQSYYGLARLYFSQKKYPQAEEFCKEALHIRERHFGENHRVLASTLSVLARIYQEQNQFELARKINMQALHIREQISGKNHPHIAVILNSLVEIYHIEDGNYQDAEPLIARALKIHEEALGSEHPYIAYSLSNKAENFFLQKNYDQAEAYYKKALSIRKQHLGPDHPHTATTYCKLAQLYSVLERYEEAEVLYRKALFIQKDAFGPNHDTVITTRKQHAIVLRRLNKESNADGMGPTL